MIKNNRIRKTLAIILLFTLIFSNNISVFAVETAADSDIENEIVIDDEQPVDEVISEKDEIIDDSEYLDYEENIEVAQLQSEEILEDSVSADEIIISENIIVEVSENEIEENCEINETTQISENDIPEEKEIHGYIDDYVVIDKLSDEFESITSEKAVKAFESSEEHIAELRAGSSEKYSSVSAGYINSVRDQNDGRGGNYAQTCWAFASAAALEANLIKNGYLANNDSYVSPGAIAYFRYNSSPGTKYNLGLLDGCLNGLNRDNYITIGGNPVQASLMFANRAGLMSEAKAPYDIDALSYSRVYEYDTDLRNISNAYWINMDKSQIDYIKKMIKEYGAITTNINEKENKIFTVGDKKLYFTTSAQSPNHSIAIVGWDDSISASDFTDAMGTASKPRCDGGWLVRDSYGTASPYRDAGYFYISYDDGCLNGTAALYNKAVAFDTNGEDYENVYQYDGTYYNSYHKESSESITAANVFTTTANTKGNEILKAVSFSTYNINSNYEIKIYTDLFDDTDPTSGDLAYSTNGSFVYAGLHTIPLDKEILMPGNSKYSVVVTITKSGSTANLLYSADHNNSYFYCQQKVVKGRSFCYEGNKWVDTAEGIEIFDGRNTDVVPGVFRIKAFTDNTDKDIDLKGEFSEDSIGRIVDQTYTGAEIKPDPLVVFNRTVLRRNIDYTVAYVNNKNVGEANITIKGIGSYKKCGAVTTHFNIVKRNLSTLSINGLTDENGAEAVFYYTGKEIEPVRLTLFDGNKTIDLTDEVGIEYVNNINAGTAKITAKGRGNFTGKIKTTFEICRRNINNSDVVFSGVEDNVLKKTFDYAYKEIEPDLEVYNKGSKKKVQLVKGKDYETSYDFNIYPGRAVIHISTPSKSNYCGQKTLYFDITKRNLSSLDISIAPAKFNGGLIEPKVTIKDGTTTLRNTIDFFVKYENNLSSGSGKAIISAKPTSAYEGVVEKSFTIEKIDISKAVLENVSNYNYVNGKSVYEQPALVVRLDGTELKKDQDYTLSYTNNNATGAADTVAKVTVKGINNYSGSKTATFTIVKGLSSKIVRFDDFTNTDLSVTLLTDGQIAKEMIYDGKTKKPEVVVKYKGTQLQETKDYTLAFSADLINRGIAYVDVKAISGSKQFIGTRRTYFYIIGRPINGEGTVEGGFSVTPPKDVVYTGQMVEPPITIKYLGRKLKEDKDYTLEYFNNGSVTNNARVVITGIGDYSKTLSFTFAILPFDLSKAKCNKIRKRTYTGYEICPDQKLKIDKKEVIMPYLEYSLEFVENVNAGEAKVTYLPISENFTGSREEKFKIAPKRMKDLVRDVDVIGVNRNYIADGVAIHPEVIVSYNGLEVLQEYKDKPIDIVVGYSKNIFPGKGVVKISGLNKKQGGSGNFKGKSNVKFRIHGRPFSVDWGDTVSSIEYTGKWLRPPVDGVIVTESDNQLSIKKDYTVSYAKNVPGQTYGEIIFKGKGLYKGESATLQYEIIPISVTTENAEIIIKNRKSQGVYIRPKFVVKVNKKSLTKGVDYLISYKNDKATGQTQAIICFIGNYSGGLKVDYSI